MLDFHLKMHPPLRKEVLSALQSAQLRGDVALVKRLLAVLALASGQSDLQVASFLQVHLESVHRWKVSFLCYHLNGLKSKKSTGRKPNLSKSQKRELSSLIEAGPQACGFSAACWRTPMIQHLINEKFCVSYSVHYISQLLKNLGFSYQKAKFVSDHLDQQARKDWKEKTFPEILKLAKSKEALLLFGDEASFPQWGTLSYTWAIKGQQPLVKTSGKRKCYKAFGLIDYFTGKFFFKTTQERLNTVSYQEFLSQVLGQTSKHIVLIQDGAKYHTSQAMKKFFEENKQRITVFNLPSYSPDFNPIEKLWKKIKEKETHMHYFPTFEALKEKVEQALVKFANAPKEILALFGFGS